MAVTLETIHKEIRQIRNDLSLVKNVIAEDYELSDDTIRKLEKARHEMKRGKYIPHKEIVAKVHIYNRSRLDGIDAMGAENLEFYRDNRERLPENFV